MVELLMDFSQLLELSFGVYESNSSLISSSCMQWYFQIFCSSGLRFIFVHICVEEIASEPEVYQLGLYYFINRCLELKSHG